MHVRVIEAGHHESAFEIDALNAFLAAAAVREHMIHLTDATDSPLADRHSLRPRMLWIIGVNASMSVVGRRWQFLRRARFRVKWCNASNNKQENPDEQLNAIRPDLHWALSSATPEIPRTVRSARFKPVSRPSESYHS